MLNLNALSDNTSYRLNLVSSALRLGCGTVDSALRFSALRSMASGSL